MLGNNNITISRQELADLINNSVNISVSAAVNEAIQNIRLPEGP